MAFGFEILVFELNDETLRILEIIQLNTTTYNPYSIKSSTIRPCVYKSRSIPEAARQRDTLQVGEHQVTPFPLANVAKPEEFPISVLLFLRLRNEPRSGSHGVEILYKHLGLQTFAVLRIDRMFFEFPNNLFRKQFHNCFMQCLSSCAGVLQDGRSY